MEPTKQQVKSSAIDTRKESEKEKIDKVWCSMDECYKNFRIDDDDTNEEDDDTNRPTNLSEFVTKFMQLLLQNECLTKYNEDEALVAKEILAKYEDLPISGKEAEGFDLFDWAVDNNREIKKFSSKQMTKYNNAENRRYKDNLAEYLANNQDSIASNGDEKESKQKVSKLVTKILRDIILNVSQHSDVSQHPIKDWKGRQVFDYTRDEFEKEQGDLNRVRTVNCTAMDRCDRNYRDDDSELEDDWEVRTGGVVYTYDQTQLFKKTTPLRYEWTYGNDNPVTLRQFVEKFGKLPSPCRTDFPELNRDDKPEVAKAMLTKYKHLPLTGSEADLYGLFDWAIANGIVIEKMSPKHVEKVDSIMQQQHDKADGNKDDEYKILRWIFAHDQEIRKLASVQAIVDRNINDLILEACNQAATSGGGGGGGALGGDSRVGGGGAQEDNSQAAYSNGKLI